MKRLFAAAFAALSITLTGCGGGNGNGTAQLYIELYGDEDMTIQTSSEYVEHGAVAYSQQDGEMTPTIEGEVDTSTPNTYIIRYTAQDSAGNTASAERYVTVAELSELESSNVDVLALYSPGTWTSDNVRPGDPETYINHAFAVVNEMFANSQTQTSFTLVGVNEYDVDDTTNSRDILDKATKDEFVENTRTELKADQVVVFRKYANDGLCGIAWVNTELNAGLGVAHVAIDCTPRTVAHEIGHNLGLNHGYMPEGTDNDLTAIKPYSIGHHIDGSFGTIMSYASQLGDVHEEVFSNPDLTCKDGQACGILVGMDKAANAARSIREVRKKVASYK